MNLTTNNVKALALILGMFGGIAAHAQQQVPIDVIDGHVIVSGSKEVTRDSLGETVLNDLRAQGVDPMNPKAGKYKLRFGGGVVRAFVYFNPEKAQVRWEVSNDKLSFNPPQLPELVLALMMKNGKMRRMTLPTNEEYALVLANELTKQGIDLFNPKGKRALVRLGYHNAKLVLDFKEDGLLQWHYKGTPFLMGSMAEGMIRILQSKGNFKSVDGKQDLLIFKGDDEAADAEKEDTKPVGNGGGAPAQSKPGKSVSDTPIAPTKSNAANSTEKTPLRETNQIKMAYSLADDHSDYTSEVTEGNGLIVTGIPKSSGKGTSDNGDPFGQGNQNGLGGNGTGIGIGLGGGNGTGGEGTGSGFGIKTSLTRGVSACNTQIGSGGHGTTTIPMNFGPLGGVVKLHFEAFSIPDQILVRCANHTLVQTSMMSGGADLQFEFKAFGVGGNANTCQIIVNGNEDSGTQWNFAISCPGQVYTGAN